MNNDERPHVNYADMKLPELKSIAKDRKIKGFSTLKKADLVTALEANDNIKSGLDNSAKGNVKSLGDFTQYAGESMVDAIKAALRIGREDRSNKGRAASTFSHSAAKMNLGDKEAAYRLQRGSETARLSPKQARRLKKSQKAFI